MPTTTDDTTPPDTGVRADAPLSRASRRVNALCLVVAVLIAWYVGFRPPNAWTATLQAVSVTDGFHRRFAIGTLLRPFAIATDYNYWVFATFSFLVLAALTAVLVLASLRAKSLTRRLLIVAFFLLPTGGFTFHIVGYMDQVLYLLLFGAIWLLNRNRPVAAALVMSLSPLVHEIAILSIIPLFGMVALRRTSWRVAILITLVPFIVNAVMLLLPLTESSAVDTLSASLRTSNFKFRQDALDLFTRSQTETWRLYRIHEIAILVRPVAMFVIGSFAVFFWINRSFWITLPKVPRIVAFLGSAAAIGLPGLLVYGGWDHNRWIMFILCNFFLVVWFLLEERREPGPNASIVLCTAVLAFSHVSLSFFPPEKPRPLLYRDVEFMFREIREGVFFETPGI